MKNSKSILILTVCFSLLVLMTTMAGAENKVTIEGKFTGANCMFFNKTCPANMSEGHIAAEPDFVVTSADGKYYYIINIDRAIKARYIHKDVRVIGILKDQQTVRADSLELKKDGGYEKIWSSDDQFKEHQKVQHR